MSKQMGYAEALSSGPRPGKKAGPKQMRSLEIEKAENGGHTVTHRFQHESDGPYHESEQHVFGASESKKLMAHLTDNLGIKAGAPEEEADGE